MPTRSGLRWPLPALAVWALAWGVFAGLRAVDDSVAAAGGVIASAAAAAAWPQSGWRRAMIAGGFPLSWLILGTASTVPPLAWLTGLGALLLVYPLRAWRDAPWFPTPRGALRGLAEATTLRAGARVLDAGCGLGDGLIALRDSLTAPQLQGVERSALLCLLARVRCPQASIAAGDMWRLDWQEYELVYLFQRPESMARALAKAEAEMAPGTWLASLEFEVPGRVAQACLRNEGARAAWLYRIGSQSGPVAADNPSTACPASGPA